MNATKYIVQRSENSMLRLRHQVNTSNLVEWHSSQVAFAFLTQPSRVQISALFLAIEISSVVIRESPSKTVDGSRTKKPTSNLSS